MKLDQINNKVQVEDKGPAPKFNQQDTKLLEEIMHDMHKTLLVADTLMRRLEQILDKN